MCHVSCLFRLLESWVSQPSLRRCAVCIMARPTARKTTTEFLQRKSSQFNVIVNLYNARDRNSLNIFTCWYVFSNVAILGAGLMGAGIAQVSIDKGMRTTLKDMSEAGLNRGRMQIEDGLELGIKKKKMNRFMSAA